MWQIRNLLSQGKPAEAIPLVDMVIEAAPDEDEAYYLRALSYYRLMEHQRSQFEFEDYMYRGLADIDKAIELRADDGDYYVLRQYLLADLTGSQFYRVDTVRINEFMLENAMAALSLGSTLDEYPDRMYLSDLIFGNRCEEAVDEIQKLIDRTDPNDPSIGGLYHMQSQAYICLGNTGKALQMLDKSFFNDMNMERGCLGIAQSNDRTTTRVQRLAILSAGIDLSGRGRSGKSRRRFDDRRRKYMGTGRTFPVCTGQDGAGGWKS
jgi:tetratricopeptide (TPR) repeat protein